ncbi:MAG TPA: phytanoyl-CoA dioxygenase family protein [Pyrinomonadaceae bacterium]|nr:phytanoyl-CoA dioxygenase family protein [Pyrinomonadaceae bacterium]
MSSELRTHAVREFRRNADEDDYHVEAVGRAGYTVLASGLGGEELRLIREKVDAVYARQLDEIGGEERLRRMNDADIARCLAGYDDYFVGVAAHPRVVSLLRRLLGDFFVLMSQNAVFVRPAGHHYQATWHRDLNYQHFVSSRPLAVSALLCVDEFSPETGGTHVLPGSHKSEEFPSAEYVRGHETQVSAPAGSIIVFDAMLFHRSGDNRSGRVRRAVNHIYTLPLIRQQISLPRMLGGKFSDDPFLRGLLGYDYETGESVRQWREGKLGKAEEGKQ